MRVAVVRERFARRRHRHSLRVDRQRAVDRRDGVVRRHVFLAVHYLVACRDRVVPRFGIGHVRNTASRSRYQCVTRQQAAAGHGDFGVLVSTAVVRPFLRCRRDRDRHRGIRHGQLAVRRRYTVVARRAGRELITCQSVRHRALARERDAARHDRSDLVIAHKAFHLVLIPAVRCAVVREFLALRRDRHSRRVDRQRTGSVGNNIVTRDAGDGGLFGFCQILLRAFRYMGDGGRSTQSTLDRELI